MKASSLLRAASGLRALSLAVVSASVLAAGALEAGWLPAQRLTHDAVPSLLSPGNARCLLADGSSGLHLVWYDSRYGGYDIFHRYFDGSSWGAEARVTSNLSVYGGPSAAVGADGRLHLAWSDAVDGTPEIYYKVWDGVSWSSATKLTDGGSAAETPSLAIDGSGRVHVLWREYRSGSWALYYRHLDGTAWSATETITTSEAYPRFPALAAAGEVLRLFWQDSRVADNAEIYYRRRSGGTWEPEERLTFAAGLSGIPAAIVDGAGRVHVFWDDQRTGAFAIYHKVHDGSAWGADEVFANATGNERGPSCCTDAAGNPAVVWYSRGSGGGIYLRQFKGDAWSGSEQVATVDDGVHYPGVALTGGGVIHAVWQNGVSEAATEIYWRCYDPSVPPPRLVSIDPSGWFACGTTEVTMHALDLTSGYTVRAWLARSGEDSIPIADVDAASPALATGLLDLGPATAGYWDVVVENADYQRDTLMAGFLVEEGLWEDEVRLTDSAGGSDLASPSARSMAVDSQGRLHLVWSDRRDGQYEIYYKCWQDGAWGPDMRLTEATGDSWAAAVAVDGQDRVHVVWSDRRDGVRDEIYYTYFDGVAWGGQWRLTYTYGYSCRPTIAATSDGRLYVLWEDNYTASQPNDIFFKVFDGSAWQPENELYDVTADASAPTVAVDDLDNLHAAWFVLGSPNLLVYRKFDGFAWAQPETLTSGAYLAAPSIVAGPGGLLDVVWQDRRSSNDEIMHKRFDGSAWGLDDIVSDAASTSQNPSAAVTPDGTCHAVWADLRWDRFEIYYSCFDGFEWSPNGRLRKATGASDRPCAVADADGNIHVVWNDYRHGATEVYYKMRRAGTTAGTVSGWIGPGSGCQLVASPNPVTTGTTLTFATAQPCRVALSVFDAAGRLIRAYSALVDEPGRHGIRWDGRDASGRTVSPGIYFCRLKAGGENATAKVVVVR